MTHIVFIEASLTGAGAKSIEYALSKGYKVSLFANDPKSYEIPFKELINSIHIVHSNTNNLFSLLSDILEYQQIYPINRCTITADFYVPQACLIAEQLNLPTLSYRAAITARPMHYHAGGKMLWFYNSVLGQRSALEIDINFMHCQPLYPIVYQPAKFETRNKLIAPMLDIHELAAGKLFALFSRNASRDLFDAHYLMTKERFDIKKLKEAFVIYVAMTKIKLSLLTPDSINYDFTDVKNRLSPVMHQKRLPRSRLQLKRWAEQMFVELREGLRRLLPLNENEEKFIQTIRTKGKIQPELITSNARLSSKIKFHPALLWAARYRNQLRIK